MESGLTTIVRKPRRDWRMPLATVLVVLATVAVYGRVCRHEFAGWDDFMTIHHNPQFNPPSKEAIAQVWREPQKGLYVPVTYSYWGVLAFMAETPDVDHYGIHLDAKVYHTGSLALHVASVLLVLAILKLLSDNVWASALGAMLFAVHPLQVESVAWASGAKDLLCGLLSLCALYQYILFAQSKGGRERWWHYGCGAVAMLLAMLSKPSAMVVPAMAAAIDLIVLRRPWRKVAWGVGGWALMLVPLTVVARIVQTVETLPDVALWKRPLVAADALAFYLWKLVWPATLSIDYARRPVRVMGIWGGVWPFVMAAVVAGVVLWVWRGWMRRPWVAAAGLVFLAGIGPVLGLTPFMFQYTSTVADHYLYLAMLGPALVATWALVRFRGPGLAAFAVVAVAALGVRSNLQLQHWKTDRAAWAHAMEVEPTSFVAPANLAVNYAREASALSEQSEEAKDAGRVQEAAQFEQRRRACYAQAAELAERALVVNPDFVNARRNAFNYYFRLGNDPKVVEHLEALFVANAKRPKAAQTDFSSLRETAALTWARLGRYDRAATQYEILVATSKEYREIAEKGLVEMRAKMAEAKLDAGDVKP